MLRPAIGDNKGHVSRSDSGSGSGSGSTYGLDLGPGCGNFIRFLSLTLLGLVYTPTVRLIASEAKFQVGSA